MRVIIIGAGRVGETLVKYISKEGHDVIVIDSDAAKVDAITDKYDCNGFAGNGASVTLLTKAGIASASLLIAVTKSDETNVLCAGVAKKLGVRYTIAAMRSRTYNSDYAFFKKEMGIDTIVNPERLAAGEVNRMLRYPEGVRVEQFGGGNVRIASLTVKENSILEGVKLAGLLDVVNQQVLVCAVEHKGKVVVPKGDTVLAAGDRITVLALGEVMDEFLKAVGLIRKIIKKVLIVGGSKIGCYLMEQLTASGVKVKLMDHDADKCRELLALYPNRQIICGNALEPEILKKELAGMDACVTTTGNDDENLIISMFAKSFGIERISAEIDNHSYAQMIKDSGMSHIFSTQDVSIAGVLRNTRIMSKDDNTVSAASIKWLYTFNEGRVEAAEFEVGETFKLLGKKLMDTEFKLKPNVLIATIMRKDTTILANGSSTVELGDRIIVVSADKQLSDVTEILA